MSSGPAKTPSSGRTVPSGIPEKSLINDPFEANPFRDQMPTNLMLRARFGKLGKPIGLNVNSHIVQDFPTKDVFQYDVRYSVIHPLWRTISDHVTDKHWSSGREAWPTSKGC